MPESSSRWRRTIVPTTLIALLAAAGPVSASRGGGPSGDVLARAVALQVNAAAHVVADARGGRSDRATGASLAVDGLLAVRTADAAAETEVGGGRRARAHTHLGRVSVQAPTVRVGGLIEAVLDESNLSLSLSSLRTECSQDRSSGSARTDLIVHRGTARLLGLDGEVHGDGVLVSPKPDTGVDLGGGVSLVLNQQQVTHRSGRAVGVTVNGAVLRAGGLVVATLASSQCQLQGGADGEPAQGPSDSGVRVDANVEAQAAVSAGTRRRVSMDSRAAGGSRLAAFRAGAYVWVAGRL